MAASKPTAQQIANAANASKADGLQAFVVQELEGSAPIKLTLRGSLMAERGVEMPSELRGSTYTPLGARQGYSTITGLTWADSEMTLFLDAPFLRARDIEVENAPAVLTPEGIHALFVQLQNRGRECLVGLASFTRRGVLRRVTPKIGRGYSVDPASGAPAPPGTNLELVLKWDWAGDGLPASPSGDSPVSGSALAGQLAGAGTSLGTALGGLDALAPDLGTALGGAIGRLRKGIGDLRKSLKGLGDLARLPAKTANQLLGTAKSVGNLVNDARSLVSDTTDDYKALGEAAKGAAAAVGLSGLTGPTAAKKAAAKRSAAKAKEAIDASGDAVVAIFDALSRRKPRMVSVRPGQSLADVARAQLGSADRWPEIAEANGIDGQQVPSGTYQVEIPPKGT